MPAERGLWSMAAGSPKDSPSRMSRRITSRLAALRTTRTWPRSTKNRSVPPDSQSSTHSFAEARRQVHPASRRRTASPSSERNSGTRANVSMVWFMRSVWGCIKGLLDQTATATLPRSEVEQALSGARLT